MRAGGGEDDRDGAASSEIEVDGGVCGGETDTSTNVEDDSGDCGSGEEAGTSANVKLDGDAWCDVDNDNCEFVA